MREQEDIRLAQRTNMVLRVKLPKKHYQVGHEYIRLHEIFDRVTGTVLYVGSGTEMSSLFVFKNAKTYIHLDEDRHSLFRPLKVLERHGLISGLQPKKVNSAKNDFDFTYRGSKRKLIEVWENIAFKVPEQAQSGLQAIYFFGVPYPWTIRAIQINVLPLLEVGGVFEGPYPYFGGRFEGAEPDKLGLERQKVTFIKTRQISSAEIERIIGSPLWKVQRECDETGVWLKRDMLRSTGMWPDVRNPPVHKK